jgi:hypothetical protein
MRERDIETKCRMIAKSKGWLLPKWVSPGNGGVPDRILIGPHGIVGFVEFKRPGNSLSPRQQLWRNKLLTRGHPYAVVDNVEAFVDFMEDLFNAAT